MRFPRSLSRIIALLHTPRNVKVSHDGGARQVVPSLEKFFHLAYNYEKRAKINKPGGAHIAFWARLPEGR